MSPGPARAPRQYGIEDLLGTLCLAQGQLPDFKAIVIGNSKKWLEPVIQQMGLAENVAFSGLVSEDEKFRLLKSSRLFLMPSKYESWGIVVGEAIVSGVPVLAYKLDCYPAVFGDFASSTFRLSTRDAALPRQWKMTKSVNNAPGIIDSGRTSDWPAKRDQLSLANRPKKFSGLAG